MLSETLITRANSTYDSWEAGSLDDQIALTTLDQIISEALEAHLLDALLAGLNNRTILLRYLGLFESALQSNAEMAQLAREQDNHRYLSYAAFLEGDIFRLQGKLGLARKALLDAYEFAKLSGDHLAEAYALHLQASILLDEKMVDGAETLAFQGLASIDLYIQNQNDPDLIYTSLQSSHYQLLARCEFARNSIPEAWKQAFRAMALAEIRGSAIEVGNTYVVYGVLSAQFPDHIPAGMSRNFDDYFQNALRQFRLARAEPEIASLYLDYARSLHQQRRTTEAIQWLEQSAELFKRLRRPVGILNAVALLAQYRSLQS